ncbi:hypothetical protein SERLA73DRAFT_70058 [Serpula lacrymans var. lacrymans S7.3]|uniref:Uncharacterized protein n=1 Tax=Serpula lacrymans var. lacrymans (strain S7.3) TaxID=936435 RepID=F8PLS0_SERL3|nr:hypothetical protein SERLA73DRAFT_70058 [Serpula lacrymans var. lacrymans S7.3]
MFTALSIDFVIRCNISIAYKMPKSSHFIQSTHGTHYLRFVNHIANLWNNLADSEPITQGCQFMQPSCPVLPDIETDKAFGLTQSENAGTFGGLFQIKAEDPNLEDNSIFDPPKCNDNLEPKYVLASMNIDLALLFLPQAPEASSLFTLDNNATTSVMQIGPPKCKVTFCDLTGDDALASEGPTVKRGRLLSPVSASPLKALTKYLPAEHQQAGTKRIQDGQMVLKGKEQTSHVDSNDQPEIIPKTNVFTSTNHDQHIISKTNVFTSTNQTSSKAIQGNQALNPIDKFFTSQKGTSMAVPSSAMMTKPVTNPTSLTTILPLPDAQSLSRSE